MNKVSTAAITFCLLGTLPMAVSAQSPEVGPHEGDHEFSISGTGGSDQSFDSGNFGMTGEIGRYTRDDMVIGIRQSVNYASIEGGSIKDDFWNGSTRGYINYQFQADRARPFIGASLGGIYGDGIENSAFAGLETGVKYYVREKTYLLARIEYQFLFDSTNDAADAFQDDGAWAYTLGMGYNF